MAKTKEISRRIKSVGSTKKITKAMEMVSAAKMRKAVDAVLKTRAYASLSWETVRRLSGLVGSGDTLHPLLSARPETKKVAILLITSNRAMCGGYNTAIINKAKDSVRKHKLPTEFIIVGKKGSVVHHQGYEVAAEFPKNDLMADSREIYPLVKLILQDYQAGIYDRVFVAYTDFVHAAKQVPRLKQLLPVQINRDEAYLGEVGDEEPESETLEAESLEYMFEPNPREVLDLMIPRLLEVQIYQAFLEANASEHSARMTAMHQATEAAEDMVSELTLFYNKARQAGITAEIAEISAGANALAE